MINVENPPNAEGKTHGRQPTNLHYIGCVFKRLMVANKRNNLKVEFVILWSKFIAQQKADFWRSEAEARLRFAPSEVGLFCAINLDHNITYLLRKKYTR